MPYWLTSYPIATLSTAGFYVLLLALAYPRTRAVIAPLFVHPIPPSQQYMRGFDAFRGFAAAFVAIGHCWWATYPVFRSTQLAAPVLAYASKGVPIFAVLSGFLIYRSVLGITSIQDLRAYVLRRFFRIYPVYLLGVLLCLVLGQYVTSEGYSAAGYLVSDIFMFPIFDWPGGFGNPPTWSLYIEALFYAVLPIVVLTVGRQRMAGIALLGIALMIVGDHPSRVFALWKYFLIGILASQASPHLRRWAWPLFIAGAALFIVDLHGPRADWAAKIGLGMLHMDGSSIGLGLACGLLLATLPHLDRPAQALNVLPLRLIGVISYSVYITHFFYIRANFPEITLFAQLGTPPMHEVFRAMPGYPAWYLPFVFFPGVFFWGAVSFLLVEKPAIRFGNAIFRHRRAVAAMR